MIAKILFLAIVGVSYVQAGLLRFPLTNTQFAIDQDVFTQLDETNGNTKEGSSLITYDESADVPVVENADENLEKPAKEGENGNGNFNPLYEFPIVYNRPENSESLTTHHVEEANDNAHEMHAHHHASTLVTEKTPVALPTTEHPTSKPNINDFLNIFNHAINDVVNENADNFKKEVGSVIGIGQSVADAAKTIADAKIHLVYSFPRIGMKVLDAWGKK